MSNSILICHIVSYVFFFFQAEDGIRDLTVTGVQTCALPIWPGAQLAIGAEAADAAPDEARKALAHLLPANAPFLHGADLEVLHHHVGLLHQSQHGLLPFRLRQVQELQPLVAVQAPVVGGHTVLERRPPGARIVALRRLHLENVGAVVAQDLAAQRATKNAGEVEDTDALKGTIGSAHKVSFFIGTRCKTGVLQATGAPSKGRPAAKAPSHSRVRERGKRRSRSGGVLHLFSRASRRRHRPRPSTWSLPAR